MWEYAIVFTTTGEIIKCNESHWKWRDIFFHNVPLQICWRGFIYRSEQLGAGLCKSLIIFISQKFPPSFNYWFKVTLSPICSYGLHVFDLKVRKVGVFGLNKEYTWVGESPVVDFHFCGGCMKGRNFLTLTSNFVLLQKSVKSETCNKGLWLSKGFIY